jgi:hypothetical protein
MLAPLVVASALSASDLPHLPPRAMVIISYILPPNSAGLSGWITEVKNHIMVIFIVLVMGYQQVHRFIALTVYPLEIRAASYNNSTALLASVLSGSFLQAACDSL